MKKIKYTLSKVRTGPYTLYTIWEESTQVPLMDFSTRDYPRHKARKEAEKYLAELNKDNPRRKI